MNKLSNMLNNFFGMDTLCRQACAVPPLTFHELRRGARTAMWAHQILSAGLSWAEMVVSAKMSFPGFKRIASVPTASTRLMRRF
jgi:hypothetical protein